MTPIIFQTQTRDQKLTQLAQEVTKAGSLSDLFSKLTANERHPASNRYSQTASGLNSSRYHHRR